MHAVIVNAIATGATITVGYTKPSGVFTVRQFEPFTLRRCDNGNTVVTGQCPHDGHVKSLSLSGIKFAHTGDQVATITDALTASIYL